MTIRIKKNSIEFVDDETSVTYTLSEKSDSFDFDGKLSAVKFSITPLFTTGSISGYTSGGFPGAVNTIDKFSFVVDGNSTDVGDLTQGGGFAAGISSSTHGYTAGRYQPGARNTIDKFSFASGGNATPVGVLSSPAFYPAGNQSETNGYAVIQSRIEKFPFATDTNSVDVADQSQGRYRSASQNSSTHGYEAGGGPPIVNTIDKFPFATDSPAVDVGDLPVGRYQLSGQSSRTSGYSTGGDVPGTPAPRQNRVDRFPFASEANQTLAHLLPVGNSSGAGQSATDAGYFSAGVYTSELIQKFSHASPFGLTSGVGNLTQSRYGAAGQQY